MRIAYVGDIVGRAGRTVLLEELAGLRRSLGLDALVVNIENAAGGYGVTPQLVREVLDAGADLLTLGNHAWDQKDLVGFIGSEPRLIRPLNMAPGTPGKGVRRVSHGARQAPDRSPGRSGGSSWVSRTIRSGRWTPSSRDGSWAETPTPFWSTFMPRRPARRWRSAIISTDECRWWPGTHTHVPTADAQVLMGGTGYITDVGMTGDYDSVIGMDKALSVQRWQTQRAEQEAGARHGRCHALRRLPGD